MTVYIVTLTSDREGERRWLQEDEPSEEYRKVLQQVNWHLKKDAEMTLKYSNGTYSGYSYDSIAPGWDDWLGLAIIISMTLGVIGAIGCLIFLAGGCMFAWMWITTVLLLVVPWLCWTVAKARNKQSVMRQWNSLTSGLGVEPLPAVSESTYWVMQLLDDSRGESASGSMNRWANRYGRHLGLLLTALNDDTGVAAAHQLHCMVQSNATLPTYDKKAAKEDEAMLAPRRKEALRRAAKLDEWAVGLARAELTSRRAGVEAVARALEM